MSQAARTVQVVDHIDVAHLAAERTRVLHEALMARPISIPPLWFYDERGSILFDEITRLEEYYPTRSERSILEAEAEAIIALAAPRTLVELGSGTCEKTRVLLDAMASDGRLDMIVPLDISSEMLERSVHELAREYPESSVVGIAADFTDGLEHLTTVGPAMIAFLGSTIGNLRPPERADFLRNVAATLRPGDSFLLGCDLIKDPARLLAAYDDAQGVTADFNRNMLRSINRAFEANFDEDLFDHVATWDPDAAVIEMRLRSRTQMAVEVTGLGLTLDLDEGEDILTETCSKFTVDGMTSELAAAGLRTDAVYLDAAGDFALLLARPDAPLEVEQP